MAVASSMEDSFRAYLREGHFLVDNPELAPLSVALYRGLGAGLPVERATVAKELSLSAREVDRLITLLPPSTIDLDGEDAVIGFAGLSLGKANHVFRVGQLKLHTWCVFDALFLPQILGKPATSVTHCPKMGMEIVVAIDPAKGVGCELLRPVMSIVAPSKTACCENLRGAFCNHVNFFVDEITFRGWSDSGTDVDCVSLEVAYGLARQRNQYRYGEHLSSACEDKQESSSER